MTEDLLLSHIDNRPGQNTQIDIKQFVRSYHEFNTYTVIDCEPATGVLYITEDNPGFISGHVRMRGKNEGRYPFHYLIIGNNF